MDKPKSWSSKMRLSFSGKSSRECIKTSGYESENVTALSNSELRVKSAPNIRYVPSFLKGLTTAVHNDVDIPESFDDFFNKHSKEVLLKYYRCILKTNSSELPGKLYISNNFLCFIVKRKVLKTVIRHSNIDTFKAQPGQFVRVVAYNMVYTFHNFQRPDSAVNFLSNYLRLTNKKKLNPSSMSTPAMSLSEAMSTDSSSLVGISPYGLVAPGRCENNSAPPSCCQQNDLSRNSGTSHPDNKSFCLASPNTVFQTSSPNDPGASTTTQRQINTPFAPVSAEDNFPVSRINREGCSLEDFLFSGLSTLSELAIRISYLPLVLFCKLVWGGTNASIKLSTRTAVALGPHPPQSFTKFVAYVIIVFLAISMAYLYYRIETLPNLESPKERTCEQEIQEVVQALQRLSDLSSETQSLVNRIGNSYGFITSPKNALSLRSQH